MHLRLRGARADRPPGHEVCDVLRRNDIEKLDARGQTKVVDLGEHGPTLAQACVDVKAVVEVRIVDQPLPAHRGSGLLEVDPHDNFELVFEALTLGHKPLRVLHGGFRVVDGAGANDHQQAVVLAMQNAMDRLPRGRDSLLSLGRDGQLGHQLIGGGEFFEGANAQVGSGGGHPLF